MKGKKKYAKLAKTLFTLFQQLFILKEIRHKVVHTFAFR